jgi:uncharacterized protein (DUF2132 family)
MTPQQHNNPLHGLTLATILEQLVTHYGWDELAERVPINCFKSNPSVKSSLTFLRKTPWARERVEGLYLKMLRLNS